MGKLSTRLIDLPRRQPQRTREFEGFHAPGSPRDFGQGSNGAGQRGDDENWIYPSLKRSA